MQTYTEVKMRTTEIKTRVVKEKITTFKCDFCDFSTKSNKGCCGVRPIMECSICNKDICYEHRDFLTEDHWSDYPSGLYICPDCEPIAKQAWGWAQEYAGRYDDICDVTRERIKEMQDENKKNNAT